MDLQDLQDDRRSDLRFGEITEKIIDSAFEVIKELETRFLESVYEKALAITLQGMGLRVQCRQNILYILSIHAHSFCSKTYT
jgi:GxxExxY protein